jgi:hypothetical protein
MQAEIYQAVTETDISSISEVGLGVLRIELRNQRAIKVARPLIQSKALRYAHDQALSFEVGRFNEAARPILSAQDVEDLIAYLATLR